MQAPTPFMIKKELQETININDLKNKEEYIFNEYKLIVGLYEEKIILYVRIMKMVFKFLKIMKKLQKKFQILKQVKI